MNKHSFLVAIGVVLMAILMIAGCGKKDDNGNPVAPGHNPKLVGTWITVTYEIAGTQLPPDPEAFPPLIEVTLNADGTLEYELSEGGTDTTGTGTWSTTGSEASISLSNGMSISGTWTVNDAGDVLTVDATVAIDLSDDGVDNPVNVPATIIFNKVDD